MNLAFWHEAKYHLNQFLNRHTCTTVKTLINSIHVHVHCITLHEIHVDFANFYFGMQRKQHKREVNVKKGRTMKEQDKNSKRKTRMKEIVLNMLRENK